MAVDTKSVKNRRDMSHLRTLDDVVADARKIAAAQEQGTLQALGNWTPGQCFNHLATWMQFAYGGNPSAPPNWFIRTLVRMMKKKFIHGSLPAGFSIPNVPGGTHGIEVLPTQEALAKLEAAVARLKREVPTMPNPVFGILTHDEWQALHVNHARLHLSFMIL
jgi:hypothetical protein